LQSRSYLFLLIVIVLAGLSGWLYTQRKYQFGLDVQGGARFTYQMDLSKLTPEQRRTIDTIRANMLNILTGRASAALGVVEANVYSKGADQFIIELPGFTDVEQARDVIGTSASIRFYHAKTVVTELADFRKYEEAGDPEDPKDPSINFRVRASGKLIKAGDPEYKEMIESWGDPIVQGDQLKRAGAFQTPQGYIPTMEFTGDGPRNMEQWSRRVRNRREKLAAVLDGKVLSIAPLENNTVLKENAQITGQFDTEYVRSLVNLLNSGALPVDLVELSSESVDPTIGRQALDMIVVTGLISFAIIAAFLIVYYVFPGVVALVALGLYVLFTLTTLKLIGATFSLAAIAGFILSVGMAVDANILVFERLKEELRNGKTLKAAIELGFRRALPAIVDSNACTILTSIVLVNLGQGPVKGFASTLIIGVAISLFTAVVVTRSLLVFLVGSKMGANPNLYGLNRQWFGEGLEAKAGAGEKVLKIVEKRNLYFAISLITMLPGLIFYFAGGLKTNVEFSGGYEGKYAVGTQASTSQILDKLEQAGIKGANVKVGEGRDDNGAVVKIAYVTAPPSATLGANPEEARAKLRQASGFDEAADRGFSSVGPVVQKESIRNAVLGVIISSALIVLYLAIRFGFALGGFMIGLRFAFATIGALLHDVGVVLGLSTICGFFFGWEVSALFITAMLTVIGFSTHDTIVIFDRIRENLRKPLGGEEIGHLINRSITQSVARSINTSATVIATLVLLIIMGSATPDLKFFNVVMLFGIISGTYSSIFNAAPILYVYDRWIAKTKGEAATLLGVATHELARQRTVTVKAEGERRSEAPAQDTGYGQIKRRRASAVRRSQSEIDEE
jgi:SecD/SecF fusion protein